MKRIIKLTESDLRDIVGKMVEDTSSDESTYGKDCDGSNAIQEPSIKTEVVRNSKTDKPSIIKFDVTTYFSSTKSDSSFDEIINKITNDVKSSMGDKEFTLRLDSISEVIGSASNYLNGPLQPTHSGRGNAMGPGGLSKPPYDNLPTKGNNQWDKNKEYALNRWKSFTSFLSSTGVKIKKGTQPLKSGSRITDTGGCTDETRDSSQYVNAGQYLKVKGWFRIIHTRPTIPVEDAIKECISGMEIVVGYFREGTKVKGINVRKNSGGHTCNYATFDIICNGVKVGTSNMNTNISNPSYGRKDASVGKDETGRVKPEINGGTVYTVFTLSDEEIERISKKGKITITMSGTPNTLTKGGTFHGDAPMVVVTATRNGKRDVLYGPKEPAKGKRPKVGESSVIARFNPCK